MPGSFFIHVSKSREANPLSGSAVPCICEFTNKYGKVERPWGLQGEFLPLLWSRLPPLLLESAAAEAAHAAAHSWTAHAATHTAAHTAAAATTTSWTTAHHAAHTATAKAAETPGE